MAISYLQQNVTDLVADSDWFTVHQTMQTWKISWSLTEYSSIGYTESKITRANLQGDIRSQAKRMCYYLRKEKYHINHLKK